MDNFTLSLDDEHVPPTAVRVEISKQDDAADLICSQPSTSLETGAPFALSVNSAETMDLGDFEEMDQSNNPSTSRVTKPVFNQAFSFSKIQVMGGSSSAGIKETQSRNRGPAVKIASFAKTSTVEHLTPTAVGSYGSPSIPSRFIPQHSSVGSKQLITQTSLPTPALNSALRSFFNYTPQTETSPSPDANQSEEEDEDEDEENIEEEEILVYMQFDSKLDSDLLQPHTPFKIIGVDSETPVLQLGNQVFEGNWKDTVGTAVFFEEHPSTSSGDPVFTKNPSSTLHYHSKTQKALAMSRIFVKPKEEDADKPFIWFRFFLSEIGSIMGAAVGAMAIVEVFP
ncbi:General transcription factor 3C polypeptide 6 [Frankliniella fusca]|uniref:General transcription factor 3C polypeptide 6 n=1 Tax=Frankliniella fusca TaxID=407009 RepID=A0AAE1HGL7_9NEOP|nr:General transcription factor 3C polypeptide 6 [Frankliniella fusca]